MLPWTEWRDALGLRRPAGAFSPYSFGELPADGILKYIYGNWHEKNL